MHPLSDGSLSFLKPVWTSRRGEWLRGAALLLAVPFAVQGAPAESKKATVIEASWTPPGLNYSLRYTFVGPGCRIESTAKNRPDAWLLYDAKRDERIAVYPHNQSWVREAMKTPAFPGTMPPIAPRGPVGVAGAPLPADLLPMAGDAGLPPQPLSGTGLPAMPPMRFAPTEAVPTLLKTDRTREICGRIATLYVMEYRRIEKAEIWGVPAAGIGAFHSYRPQPLGGFGPPEFNDLWAEVLRREGLFPLLAILKLDDVERARFSVTAIVDREIFDPDAFFVPPASYRGFSALH